MRRSEKATDIAKAEELLRSKDFGVLSVCGDDGYPYGVPINYVYDEGRYTFTVPLLKATKLMQSEKTKSFFHHRDRI